MPLDTEIAAYLEERKKLPPSGVLSVEQTRARMVEWAGVYGGTPVEVREVREFLVGGVPVRDYRKGPGVLVVYFHGGRFVSGGLDSHDRLCRRLADACDGRVIAADYRLAPEHRYPAAIEDAATVVDWAVEQAERVAVAGDSAGANLAAVAASLRRGRVWRQVLIYPMIDAGRTMSSHAEFGEGWGPTSLDMQRGWDEYVPAGVDARDPQISPFYATDLERLPDALVLTAEYDCLRDEGEDYAHRMGQAGNRVELKRCLGTIHGFITLTGISRLARETVEDIGRYLRR